MGVLDYNELIPPENPKYPWTEKDWQVLCYYCCEPIYPAKDDSYYAGYRQRVIRKGSSRWLHNGYVVGCDPSKVRPNSDPPRCHICGGQNGHHEMICSAAGVPAFRATTMTEKEEEVRRAAAGEAGAANHDATFKLWWLFDADRFDDGVNNESNGYVKMKIVDWITLRERIMTLLGTSPLGTA